MTEAPRYDLVVIGGGINGVGIARDAAGRGLATLLCEQNDLGWATSSASSKLIHGGLRYLEYYEFRLVAEALAERETLLAIAPHIVRPLEFVLPHERHLRPAWMIRLGLFLYDNLAWRPFARGHRPTLPKSRSVRLVAERYGAGLKPEFTHGFAYYDAWVDDARLVVLTARSAAEKGAAILPRTRCVAAVRTGERWRVTLRDVPSGREQTVEARALVNAAGPWVKRVLDRELATPSPYDVRLVRGSHIIVSRLYAGEHAYILQNPDRRVVFLLPFERDFTAIGTTEVPTDNPDERPACSRAETEYLCAAASRYTQRPVTPADVVATWSGVRPLFDDGRGNVSSVTRDYVLHVDAAGPPLVSVFGGKITTYRKLAEAVLGRLAPWLGERRAWTTTEALPGGDCGGATFADLVAAYRSRYPQLPPPWLERLLRRHGTNGAAILGDARSEADLGRHFGGGLYEREVRYLVDREWACTAEDVLWRRTKFGLRVSPAEREALAQFLESRR
ncbi:MAG: glycerol-3-phosphate dehydrogenase [Burkholderiales bacterium]|nr:glycerol-3-phosphate dehydrogenase [Burkholderiales bacterium]